MRPALPELLVARPRLLIVGLNPGAYSAEVGHYYARPANRFWRLLFESGLVATPLLAADDVRLPELGIALTDLCRRATRGIHELSDCDFRRGAPRIRRLIRDFEPGVVAFNGLAGYRAAFDRRATLGEQPERIEGRPLYVMGSTSPRVATWSYAEQLTHWIALRRRVESEDRGRPIPRGRAPRARSTPRQPAGQAPGR